MSKKQPRARPPFADCLLVDIADIAAETGVAVRTINRWRSAGRFPAPDKRIGNVLRWKPATVLEWIGDKRI